MSDQLPTERYAYRRVDGRLVIVEMTLAERLARELTPGRILHDGIPAERDLEYEAAAAPEGTLDIGHLAELRRQLEALGS